MVPAGECPGAAAVAGSKMGAYVSPSFEGIMTKYYEKREKPGPRASTYEVEGNEGGKTIDPVMEGFDALIPG